MASKSVLTVDSTKYGKFGTFTVARLEEFDLIITDDRLPPMRCSRCGNGTSACSLSP